MSQKLRPMLAASFDDPQDFESELVFLNYPLLASPKIDGIRWMKPPGEPIRSRTWTPLPNQRLQDLCQDPDFNYLDGEVIFGDDPALKDLYNITQSAIMTRHDDRPFSLWVFDHWENVSDTFMNRTQRSKEIVEEMRRKGILKVNYVEHSILKTPAEVLEYEEAALEAGYEGIMLRGPGLPYKFGRSTLKQQGLIKVKRFADAEAQIVGFEELERNTNEQVRNAFGLAKRSSHKAGKVAGGTLGRFILSNEQWGEFGCGSGLDDDLRDKVWQDKDSYLGKIVTFKYQAHGTVDKPRMPIFKGFRED